MSDGHHVVLPMAARGMHDLVRARGFEPVPVEMSEFVKAGGGVKCCTLEIAVTGDLLTRRGLRRPAMGHGYCAPNYDPLPVTLTARDAAPGSRTTTDAGTSISSPRTPR